MRVGSLFSGIGGLDLGLEWAGMEIVWQCEKDQFCRGILRSHWPQARLYDDITTITANDLAPVDLICGGFPCQPVSLAGRRQGKDDARWLWPAMRDVISHVEPTWVLGENTPGLITMGLDGVLLDLETLGYACRTFVVPACAVNAPHRRDRVFIVAHASRGGFDQGSTSLPEQAGGETLAGDGSEEFVADAAGHSNFCQGSDPKGALPERSPGGPCGCGAMVNANSQPPQRWGVPGVVSSQTGAAQREPQERQRCRDAVVYPGQGTGAMGNTPGVRRGLGRIAQGEHRHAQQASAWSDAEWITGKDGKARRVKPGVRLLAHGVPGRVARLKGLGNAVVPEEAFRFGRAIMAAHYGVAA